MPSNLLFDNELATFENYDNNTNTLTIKDSEDTYYLTFYNYIPS